MLRTIGVQAQEGERKNKERHPVFIRPKHSLLGFNWKSQLAAHWVLPPAPWVTIPGLPTPKYLAPS